VQRGTRRIGEAENKSPRAGAGGAQFDLYKSMSENTRLASAVELSESTASAGARFQPPAGWAEGNILAGCDKPIYLISLDYRVALRQWTLSPLPACQISKCRLL
jgi:hypothetical protein